MTLKHLDIVQVGSTVLVFDDSDVAAVVEEVRMTADQGSARYLTFEFLLMLVPAALVGYLPYRYVSISARNYIQYAVAGLGICWGLFRFFQHIPADKLLIEEIAVIGLSFGFSDSKKTYNFVLLTSLVLTAYSTIVPGRLVGLVVLPVIFALGLLLSWQSRTSALGREPGLELPRNVGSVPRTGAPATKGSSVRAKNVSEPAIVSRGAFCNYWGQPPK